MKALTVKLLLKVALPVLLASQVLVVNASEGNAIFKEPAARQPVQAADANTTPPQTEKQQLRVQTERKDQQVKRKTGGYVSILSVIINDALGHANKDIRTRSHNEAGKISF